MDGKRVIPDVVLASMGTDHVVSGGPGPLFGAGWAAACECWSKKLLADYPPYEAEDEATQLVSLLLAVLEREGITGGARDKARAYLKRVRYGGDERP